MEDHEKNYVSCSLANRFAVRRAIFPPGVSGDHDPPVNRKPQKEHSQIPIETRLTLFKLQEGHGCLIFRTLSTFLILFRIVAPYLVPKRPVDPTFLVRPILNL